MVVDWERPWTSRHSSLVFNPPGCRVQGALRGGEVRAGSSIAPRRPVTAMGTALTPSQLVRLPQELPQDGGKSCLRTLCGVWWSPSSQRQLDNKCCPHLLSMASHPPQPRGSVKPPSWSAPLPATRGLCPEKGQRAVPWRSPETPNLPQASCRFVGLVTSTAASMPLLGPVPPPICRRPPKAGSDGPPLPGTPAPGRSPGSALSLCPGPSVLTCADNELPLGSWVGEDGP